MGGARRPPTLGTGWHAQQAIHTPGSTRPRRHPRVRFPRPTGRTQDRPDAERIARTIEGLRVHNARHRAAGHGFGFTEIDGNALRVPTIAKSYHKINTGPFVRTPFGLRLLQQAEIERLHGHTLLTRHYATAVQMLGQGVQTRVFRSVVRQLADHLGG